MHTKLYKLNLHACLRQIKHLLKTLNNYKRMHVRRYKSCVRTRSYTSVSLRKHKLNKYYP